ncbi:MAG TPA: class I SAM-dependent methyltransferase [Chitinophagaceae bacterium]
MSSLTEFAGSIPYNYDQYLGPLFFEPYAEDIYGRLKGKRYQRVLELACGTGRLTRFLAELTREEGQLYATDLNPDMLQLAKEKTDDGRIRWGIVDAHELPYDTGFFDLVVCQFGVMFFKDKTHAFGEALRVLQPGGTFLFNTWDHFQYNAASRISQLVLSEVLAPDPPDFLEKGPYSFFDPAMIRGLLEEAGFTHIRIETVAKMGALTSPGQVAAGFVDGSPLTGYLNERGAPKAEIKQRITEAITAEFMNMMLPMQALVCSAQKSTRVIPV